MTTEKQIGANQQNSKKSTGPKTQEGKAISSKNAQKHGLYSCNNVLPQESNAEYRKLVFQFLAQRGVNGTEDEQLVRLLVDAVWRLRRCGQVDAELYRMYGKYEGEDRGVGTAFAYDAMEGNAFSKLARYRAACFRELVGLMKLLDATTHKAKAGPAAEIDPSSQTKKL